ncbi:MAG: cell division protein ZapA [Elusimicrobia bacterium]|nr:cell division protein ZapA [Elusimicrobiota bacterium]
MKDTFQIEIRHRRLAVDVEGITQMEVTALAKEVEDKMLQIEQKYNTPDSSKIALYTALAYAEEIHHQRNTYEVAKDLAERKIEKITHLLRAALDTSAPSGSR